MTPQQLFELAVQNHQAGRLREAESFYRQLLAIQPTNADALQLLSVLAFQVGQTKAALDLVDRAIAVNPNSFDYHCNRGNFLAILGRLDEALAATQTAVRLKPDSPEAHNNMADVLCRQKQFAEAARCAEQALFLRPDYPDALNNLGIAQRNTGQVETAIETFRRALALVPKFTKVWSNLGQALMDLGQNGAAAEAFAQAVACEPRTAGLRHAVGIALRANKQLPEAIAAFRAEMSIRPGSAELHNDLAVALQESGSIDEAAAEFRRAIEIKPDFGDPYYNLGTILQDRGQLEQAMAFHRLALKYRPDFAKAHNNLATALRENGQIDEAVASVRTAIAHKPDWPMAHHNLGLMLLFKGEYEEGWREHEWRSGLTEVETYRPGFTQPQWTGEDISGKTLLLHAEQGFGDAIQFVRYIALIAPRCQQILLQCQPELVRLFEHIPGVQRVIPRGHDPGHFDLHCPLLSLPLLMGTRLDTIPNNGPYLIADPELSLQWRKRLPTDRFKVGLNWAGRPTHKNDSRRSIRLEALWPLTKAEGVEFYSLQKYPPATVSGTDLPTAMSLTDWTAELGDFADSAALVDNLDLVITVDTAIAHLAGALAKPVWVLLPFVADWRWGMNGDLSPWYPTARLFRQPKMGDWDSAIAKAADALRAESAKLAKS